MLHLDLFSGIGGFTLACDWAGIETIGFVEIDKYCQKVLRKHWPDVPIVEDIRDVEKIEEIVANAERTGWGNQREPRELGEEEDSQGTRGYQSASSFRDSDTARGRGNANKPPTILVTAGFPCQPFSVAGKRQGEGDDRYLWPETLAVIKAIKPTWILLENVAGIINLALDTVLSDLEGAGYATETLVIPACAVNAPHRRDRIWIVAYTTRGQSWQSPEPERWEDSGRGSQEVAIADTNSKGLQGGITEGKIRSSGLSTRCSYLPEWQEDWWAVEPELGLLVDGLSPKLDGGIDEILRTLWQTYGTTKMVKRAIRQHLGEKKILQQQMLRRLDYLTKQGKEKERTEESTTTNPQTILRDMWLNLESPETSQGQQSSEQYQGKSDSSMPSVPQRRTHEESDMGDLWLQEPNIPRVASGIKERVNQLKCLGNAIVPQVAYEIIKAIQSQEASIRRV